MHDTPTEPIPVLGNQQADSHPAPSEQISKNDRVPATPPNPRWQAQLLRRVQHWAAELTRISELGPAGYDGTDLTPAQEWASQINALQAALESAEDLARQAGLEPAWIEDIRELGHRTATTAPQADPTPGTVTAATSAQQFLVDMMNLDLWNLQRMAFLVAAYQDRVATGRSSITFTPQQRQQFGETMRAHWTKATRLAQAAGITAAEAEQSWGVGSNGWHALHRSYVSAHDEAGLVAEMRRYLRAEHVTTLPPGVAAEDPGSTPGAPSVPTPEDLVADAYAAIRANFIDTAVADLEGGRAAAEAIESALPAAEATDRSATTTDLDQSLAGPTLELGAGPGP
ncbi:hypothetical protein [Nocardia sp. NPDC050435]|uniref:hypothetical protein n=1 Tax=Nocardia sp. NPDC050435 TaxID=3155040 RepID=UPI0033F0F263